MKTTIPSKETDDARICRRDLLASGVAAGSLILAGRVAAKTVPVAGGGNAADDREGLVEKALAQTLEQTRAIREMDIDPRVEPATLFQASPTDAC